MEEVSAPWPEGPDHENWNTLEITDKILGVDKEGAGHPIPIEWARTCATRVKNMRNEMRRAYVGMEGEDLGSLIDWIIAALIARENVLLLGPPGVAKTEMAVRLFELLSLKRPKIEYKLLQQSIASTPSIEEWWVARSKHEARQQKYFQYLLSRFTQPEELFGPIEIDLLRRGILARINFGFLTGPGVYAAFLDEIFKASSSILNTLLTLMQERKYFNLGGMEQSNLMMFIGASNELPGGFGTTTYGMGSGGDDFQTLYAFLDRFPIRLQVPPASGTSKATMKDSDLTDATDMAIRREAQRMATNELFEELTSDMPVVNDILLLGRCTLQHIRGAPSLFGEQQLQKFQEVFYKMAVSLQQDGTSAKEGTVKWTISPRKLKALFKIGLAHALVHDNSFVDGASIVSDLGRKELHVLDLIWDSPMAQPGLVRENQRFIKQWRD
jgi:MoxR-like ATPase